MKLTRPLVYLDIESTGTDVMFDRIITLFMLKEYPDLTTSEMDLRFNPGRPIPKEAADIHGMTDEMVKDWPLLDEKSGKDIIEFISGCDLCGFNATGFDVQILQESLLRVGLEMDLTGVAIIDPGVIFKRKEERSLVAAVKFYCRRSHEGAHGARADVLATRDVLRVQLGRYTDLWEMDAAQLSDYCATDRDGNKRLDLNGTIVLSKAGVPVFNTKRNRGVPVAEEHGYANWMLRSDFPTQTKRVISKILSASGADDLF